MKEYAPRRTAKRKAFNVFAAGLTLTLFGCDAGNSGNQTSPTADTRPSVSSTDLRPAAPTQTEAKPTFLLPEGIHVTEEMKTQALSELRREYNGRFKDRYLLDGGDGTKYFVYSEDKKNAAMEVQSYGELIAVALGDSETAESMFRFDDRYKQKNGLIPWLIKSDGKVDDDTVVTPVMMTLAAARLLSSDPRRVDEGRQMVDDIKRELINPETNIPQARHGYNERYLASPAYMSPYMYDLFAKQDPYWNTVAAASRGFLDKIADKINAGEIAYFPNWVDMRGNIEKGAEIEYDTAYIPSKQAMAALYCKDEEARLHAAKMVAIANRFYSGIITSTDKNGKKTYDRDKLLDGYELDGKHSTSDNTQTAFTSAAAVASIASDDEGYRTYMFKEGLLGLEQNYAFNVHMRNLALFTLSGKLG